MKIIRITTENEVSVHEFPEGNTCEQLNELGKLIGIACDTVEHVMPNRLYTVLGASNRATEEPGSCANMLVDETGYYHELPVNYVGCWLYETDIHRTPILGNILIAGEEWNSNGISFCGLSDEQFEMLYPKLLKIAEKARRIK